MRHERRNLQAGKLPFAHAEVLSSSRTSENMIFPNTVALPNSSLHLEECEFLFYGTYDRQEKRKSNLACLFLEQRCRFLQTHEAIFVIWKQTEYFSSWRHRLNRTLRSLYRSHAVRAYDTPTISSAIRSLTNLAYNLRSGKTMHVADYGRSSYAFVVVRPRSAELVFPNPTTQPCQDPSAALAADLSQLSLSGGGGSVVGSMGNIGVPGGRAARVGVGVRGRSMYGPASRVGPGPSFSLPDARKGGPGTASRN